MSRLMQARAALLVGAALVTVGVFGFADWPAAALAAGVQSLVYGLWFVDVDDAPRRPIERGGR